jgi:hypothetical protein
MDGKRDIEGQARFAGYLSKPLMVKERLTNLGQDDAFAPA